MITAVDDDLSEYEYDAAVMLCIAAQFRSLAKKLIDLGDDLVYEQTTEPERIAQLLTKLPEEFGMVLEKLMRRECN